MELVYAVVADQVIQHTDGKTSIIGMYDTIHAAEVPLVFPVIYMALAVMFEPADAGEPCKVDIRLINEDGKTVAHADLNMTVKGHKQDHRIILALPFERVGFEDFGDYRFDISLNGEASKTMALHVNRRPNDKKGS